LIEEKKKKKKVHVGFTGATSQFTMVRGTGPTTHTKKPDNAATNGSKPVSTQKKKTAPKSKTPTLPPTKYCVHKSVVEQLDAALQPSTSAKIIIPKCTTTCISSVE